jgi:membrane-bound lytic murein transglycosylase D
MYATGKIYGLEVNSYVDYRRDPVQASEAAAKFLSDLYAIYHDWTLVIAAYNCGPGNVNKAIRRSGGKRDFWEIYYRLPKETRGYVPAFIAANYAFAYYKEHNIIPTTIDLNIATDTIAINDFLHFEQISQVINISVEELRDLNPQYKKDVIPAKTRTYPLRLPVDYVDDFIDLKDSIFAYKDSVYFSPERKVVEPPKYQKGGTTANYSPPPTKDMIKIMYNVKSGDNVGFISSWYGVGVSDVSYWNNLYKNRIRAGQKLVIYKHKNVASKYVGINKMSFDAKQKMIGKPVSKTSTIKSEPSSNSSGNYVYYTVRQGDNFWSIAKKYPGVSNDEIMKLNGITDPTSLKAGQKLKIKKK